VTTGPTGTVTDLREFLENLVGICTARARGLEKCVMAWPEECDEKDALLADIEHILKIAERAQKLLTQMRKDDGSGACMNSCETFAAAMLEATQKAERERGDDGKALDPADGRRRGPG
jgi:hypothetical protein